MTRPRAWLAPALAGALLLTGAAPALAAQDATPEPAQLTELPEPTEAATPAAAPPGGARLFELPGEAVFPEGVAYQDETGDFFVGSTTDGSIYRGNVETGEVAVFVEGAEGGTAIGLELDDQGRLYVAGGTTGLVSVYDTATGALIAEFGNNLAPNTFVNDVAITGTGDAYATDSFNPFIYVVPAAAVGPGAGTPIPGANVPDAAGVPVGPLEVAVDLSATPFQLGEGFNGNGIVVTPDDRYLLVAQSNTGNLYRVDLASQEVVEVDLEGDALPGGDGLLLEGRTLYAVTGEEISVVELAEDYATGTVVDSFSDPSFSTPTTLARYDGCFLVVNSQFANQQGTPDLPFTVSGIPAPALGEAAGATPVGDGC